MSPNRNIVSLHEHQEAKGGRLPSALVRLRDLSSRRLHTLLDEFFHESDDALFAMADKAGTNAEQTAYFDAMRELRLQRRNLTLSFQQYVARAFNELGSFDPQVRQTESAEPDLDSLSLVGEDELEERVAVENMVNKVRSRHDVPSKLLQARVEHLVPQLGLSAAQIPLSPEVLCQGLAEACADLAIDIRAKLIVYKLFDRLLIGRLGTLYEEANLHLANEGVLPDLKWPMARRQAPRGTSAGRPSGGGSGSAGPGGDSQGGGRSEGGLGTTFEDLSALLHQGGAGTPGGGGPVGGGGGQSLGTEQLLGFLSSYQGQAGPAGAGSLGGMVSQLVQEQAAGGQVQQVDADVINLVSMLFDFILEDRQLPEKMKALISRLQIPILKVALLDRSFFNRGGHPARKLLNELAVASLGWNEKAEGQRDPLGEKIESVVERLLNEFDNDVRVFEEVLEDFTRFTDLERRRRELVEQRLRDAEEGRARSEWARQEVDALLERLTRNRTIPQAVQGLLDEPWHRVLSWTLLREGEDSDAWKQAVALTKKLIWTLDPRPVDRKTRPRLLKLIPGVVDGLREGLARVSWDPFDTDRRIRDLEMVHVDTLQNLNLATGFPEPEAGAEQSRDPEPAGGIELLDTAPPIGTPSPAREESRGADRAEPGEAPESPAATPAPEAQADQAPSPWITRAQALRVGSWLELKEEERVLRCKLAAIIKATGKYIFVNRSGAKVAEYSLDQVARALEEERVVMLDDGLIFDRALESVIGNLRSNRRD